MSVLHVDVVSATEEIYSGEAKCVFAPATIGEIGVYPMHVPLISTLKPCLLYTSPSPRDS